ncbi:hypothetical protein SAMN05192541_109343 [Bradyrhizobium arachidis]|nr:hypothetical protein SAMN05192541_109343 [Bradyrhizobium arachidis]
MGMESVRGFSAPFVRTALLLVCLALATAPQAYRSFQKADGLPHSWTTAKVWLASADCARATHKFLVLCHGEDVVPIADGFGGDDLGHALALEVYSVVSGAPVRPEQISHLNTALNYTALIAVALLLMACNLPVASLSVLTVGAFMARQFHALTPHPAQFAAACFAVILPIAILGRPRFRAAWIAAGFVGLAVALLLREAIGMMGVLTALIATILLVIRERKLAPVVLALAIVATAATPYALLRARDAVYQLPPPEKLESHGTWANLYMGLGGVPNPFGIEWSDYSAIDAVKAVDPAVPYLSPRFYEILRERYLDLVRQHPAEVASIYWAKLVLILHAEMSGLPFAPTLWPVLLVLAISGALVRWYRRSDAGIENFDAVMAASASMAAGFVAQGVLIYFHMQYMFPIQMFLLLGAAVLIDVFLAAGMGRLRK